MTTGTLTSNTSSSTRRNGRIDISDIANITLFLAAFLGAWQLVFLLKFWPDFLLPSPAMVTGSITKLITNYSLLISIGVTLGRLGAGFLIAIGIGGGVGLAMVRFPGFGKTMSSFAAGLLTFPSITWAIFSILPFGINNTSILFVVIMASVFSIMITTYGSIRNIPPIYLRAARNMGATGFTLFRHVMIPAATPSLIIGIRQAWSFAWHALIGAEIVIGTLYGLGHLLLVGEYFNDMGQIITVMVTLFVIGVIFDRVLFLKLEDRVRTRWGLSQHS